MTIGERIKQARKARGLTQKQLGEVSGTSEITVRQYEIGKRQPRVEQLQAIAAALNVSVGFLLDGHRRLKDICKEWKSDKAARLYMRIDSTLLDDLERIAKLDNVPLDDIIEEILYWDVEKRIEDRMNEEDAKAMQEWYDRRAETAPTAPAAPTEGKDTTPPPDAPEGPGNGE